MRLGGAHGALGGAGVRATADADAESASSGLAGGDGSVSSALRLVDERTNYDMACEFIAVSDVMTKRSTQGSYRGSGLCYARRPVDRDVREAEKRLAIPQKSRELWNTATGGLT